MIWGLYRLAHRAVNWISHKYYVSQIKGHASTLLLKGRISILFPEKLTVGSNCCINEGVLIHCGGGLQLGNNVTISMGAKLITRSYVTEEWKSQCEKQEFEMDHVEKPIWLADHTWIGAGAMILPGITISGKGVIVAAGAVVTHDIKEDYVLVAGLPAKVVKRF